jgi:hypothetical protein
VKKGAIIGVLSIVLVVLVFAVVLIVIFIGIDNPGDDVNPESDSLDGQDDLIDNSGGSGGGNTVTISENFGNIMTSIPIASPNEIDLTPSLVHLTYEWINANTADVTFAVTIENLGSEESGLSNVRLIIQELGIDRILSLVSIPAGSFYELETIIENVGPGNYEFTLIVDSENNVFETNEQNNEINSEMVV